MLIRTSEAFYFRGPSVRPYAPPGLRGQMPPAVVSRCRRGWKLALHAHGKVRTNHDTILYRRRHLNGYHGRHVRTGIRLVGEIRE